MIISTLLGIVKKTANESSNRNQENNGSQFSLHTQSTDDILRETPGSRGGNMEKERIKIDFLIHDLKVPLAVIEAGITSLLNRQEKYGKLTHKQEKVLRRALRNTRVTQTLVNDALELGRSKEGVVHVSTCSISELVKNTLLEVFDLTNDNLSEQMRTCSDLSSLKEVLGAHGVSLNVENRLWAQEVCLDEPKVRQILRNLLNNALKYKRNTVEVTIRGEGDTLVLTVSDDGEGIPQEYHERIFECYFQMNGQEACPVRGHGVGLAGVLVLVEDMGGKLTLHSDRGCGATFSVTIPLSETC